MHRPLTLLLLPLVIAVAAFAPPPPGAPDDEAAVRTLLTDFVAAFNAHDAGAHAALYADGAEIVWADGERAVIDDRAAFLAMGREWHAANASMRIEAAPVSIRFPAPDVAVAFVEGTATMGGQTIPMSILFVLKETPAGWRIVAEHEMAIYPQG